MNKADYLRDTIDLVKQIETRFLELGARLYTIKEKELWSGQYESFQEFLETARINPAHASIWISIHKSYIIQGGLTQKQLVGAGYTNLYASIPLIEKEGVEKALTIASTLTRSEIQQEVRDITHSDCTHEHTITLCATCHKKV